MRSRRAHQEPAAAIATTVRITQVRARGRFIQDQGRPGRSALQLVVVARPSALSGPAFRSALDPDYQSYFTPNRMMRGPMIVAGSSKLEPELQVMFDAALLLVKL